MVTVNFFNILIDVGTIRIKVSWWNQQMVENSFNIPAKSIVNFQSLVSLQTGIGFAIVSLRKLFSCATTSSTFLAIEAISSSLTSPASSRIFRTSSAEVAAANFSANSLVSCTIFCVSLTTFSISSLERLVVSSRTLPIKLLEILFSALALAMIFSTSSHWHQVFPSKLFSILHHRVLP